MKHLTTKLIASAVMGGCLFAASSSLAVEVHLRAAAFDKTLPGGKVVKMWGFALENATWTGAILTNSPGPTIVVPDTDTTLTIHLTNNLAVPVSLVIPNQNGFDRDAAHATFVDGQGRTRAKSFVKETAPNSEGTYTWNNLTPGTYLYYSGSHSSLQVQMGLYGAVVQKESATEIYPLVPAPASEQVLLFSEIDTKVHDAVAANNYGPGKSMTSTIHSIPDYFLINGQAFQTAPEPLPILPVGIHLLRFLNAGVNSRVPVIYGLDQKVIAEDGRLYPYARNLSAPELPAMKTMDVLVSPLEAGTYPLYDRALGLVNGTTSPGGMLTYLQVPAP